MELKEKIDDADQADCQRRLFPPIAHHMMRTPVVARRQLLLIYFKKWAGTLHTLADMVLTGDLVHKTTVELTGRYWLFQRELNPLSPITRRTSLLYTNL